MRVGMDVSTWQKNIDYTKARKDVSFIIPRSGFGLNTDNTYRRNVKEAIANGIEVPAIYHFSYALCATDAVYEADYAISEAEVMGLPKTTIIFFDFEYASANYAKKKGVKVDKELVNAVTIAFCDRCKSKGWRTGIYLNLDYYKNWYYPTTLAGRIIWLADWSGGPDYPCYIQQYTSKGQVAGVKGNVDMNYIFDNVTNDTKSIHEIALEVIAGKWGNGPERKNNITGAGYDYTRVQQEVNNILTEGADTATTKPVNGDGLAIKHSESKVGVYMALENMYLRKGAGDNKYAVVEVPKGTPMYCYGFYDITDDEPWLYVQCTPFENGIVYAGFVEQGHTILSSRNLQTL